MNHNSTLYTPGTTLTVGSHQVSVVKYFSKGGFAQVYVVNILSGPSQKSFPKACLKRVMVPNKQNLNSLRAEVDCMKLLKGNKHVVTYIDSNASKSATQPGAYEVFVLMEYCGRGGLIDFMNTRLQNRLSEAEVLNILSQTAQGVAAMHRLQPPLLHRDIKIENVLINDKGEYKLCDFGSVCGIIRPPKTQQEYDFVSHDILSNTTAQYRAPEMLDLSKGLPIDEKSDMWALGVYLYKLCYYTTPFEKNGGDQAILRVSYQFPQYPVYSDKVKNLVNCLLRENPFQRPNICQLVDEISRLQNVASPLENFYVKRATVLTGKNFVSSLKQEQQPQPQQTKVQLQVPGSMGIQQPLVPDVSNHAIYQPKMPLNMEPQYKLYQSKTTVVTGSNYNNVPMYNGASTGNNFQKLNLSKDPFSAVLLNAKNDAKSAPSTTYNTGGTYPVVDNYLPYSSSFPNNKSGKVDLDYKTVLQRTTSRSSKTSKAESFASVPSTDSVSSSSSDEEDEETAHLKSYPALTSQRNSSTGSLPGNLEIMTTGGSFTQRLGNRLKKIVTGESFKTASRQNTGNSMSSPVRRSSSRKVTPNNAGSIDLSNKIYDEERISRFKSDGGFSNKRKSMIIPDLDSPDKPTNFEDIEKYYSNSRSSSPTKNPHSSHSKDKAGFLSKTTNSIQNRVNALLTEPKEALKSASGYGKYTDLHGSKNKHEQQRNLTTIVTPVDEVREKDDERLAALRKLVQGKKKKVPPKKPKKPAFLTSGKGSPSASPRQDERERMTSTALLDEDVDAMTNDFSNRFPSVL